METGIPGEHRPLFSCILFLFPTAKKRDWCKGHLRAGILKACFKTREAPSSALFSIGACAQRTYTIFPKRRTCHGFSFSKVAFCVEVPLSKHDLFCLNFVLYNFKTLVRMLKDFCPNLFFPLSCLVLNAWGDEDEVNHGDFCGLCDSTLLALNPTIQTGYSLDWKCSDCA